MTLIKVRSGNLDAVGYDQKKRTLYIRFIGNKLYRYWPVPKLFWVGLQKAPSKGTFFQQWIKGNFNYEAVDDNHM